MNIITSTKTAVTGIFISITIKTETETVAHAAALFFWNLISCVAFN